MDNRTLTPFLMASLLALLLWLSPAAFAARGEYGLDYLVAFEPAAGQARVEIAISQGDGATVHEVTLRMPASRYTQVTGDGAIVRRGDHVSWKPRATGTSTLRYRYRIDDRRRDGGYDARITDTWTIVRGDDLVPSATVRATKGADSRARLRFDLPPGWPNVDTPFRHTRDRNAFVIVNPERRFDRPTGWIIAGDVGTRREMIGNTEISVAGPKGDSVRRNDMLAFFNGLVPQFEAAFGDLPGKLLIVSAGDPMWRGGLSGPRSLFLHSDRPLISENGTSTLTHELTHVITRVRGADDDDWIAEGIAEYYSIELLRRAGLLSEARADKAQEWMKNHGRRVTSLGSDRSHGPRTARAVQLFRELDAEIRTRTKDRKDLDDLVQALIPLREVSREDLREQVEELTGAPSRVLATRLLD